MKFKGQNILFLSINSNKIHGDAHTVGICLALNDLLFEELS